MIVSQSFPRSKTLTPAPLPTTPTAAPGEGCSVGAFSLVLGSLQSVLPLLPGRGNGAVGRRGPG